MKWIVAAMALSLSFMVGCQCTEKANEVETIPVEEQQQFEGMDESVEEVPVEDGTTEEVLEEEVTPE